MFAWWSNKPVVFILKNYTNIFFYMKMNIFLQEGQENVDILPAESAPGRVDPEKRMTTPYLTKYERARVLGTRALQIA